jgi:hypothetical protein
MVHPPRPGAQCVRHIPTGLLNASIRRSLQHSEQSPQLRPGTNCTTLSVLFDMGPAPSKDRELRRMSVRRAFAQQSSIRK